MRTVFAALALTSLAIGSSASATAVAIDTKPVADSNNAVGFRLTREAVSLQKNLKNTLISPISAHFALSMALNGASGKTMTSFQKALDYKPGQALEGFTGINSQNRALRNGLLSLPSAADLKALKAWEKRPSTVSIQNSIWSTNGKTDGVEYNFAADYEKTMKTYYGVSAATALDFQAPKSADTINDWTSKQTNGMIPTIIDAQTMAPLKWILLNTAYVDVDWYKPFGDPYEDEFTKLDGKKIKVQMIHQMSTLRFGTTTDYDVAELEIANGKDKSTLVAYVILPKQASKFESLATSDKGVWSDGAWKDIFAELKPALGNFNMPAFTFDDGVEMKEDQALTKAMGFNFLFKDSAEFATMDGNSTPTKIGIVKQNTKVNWTDRGVSLAAATLVGGMIRGAVPRPVVNMNVDRPFFIAIYDTNSGAFLFTGQVVEPRYTVPAPPTR